MMRPMELIMMCVNRIMTGAAVSRLLDIRAEQGIARCAACDRFSERERDGDESAGFAVAKYGLVRHHA